MKIFNNPKLQDSKEVKRIGYLQMTKNYDMFVCAGSNRNNEKAANMKKIDDSIQNIGFVNVPIVVARIMNSNKKLILDGHQRFMYLQKHNMPIVFVTSNIVVSKEDVEQYTEFKVLTNINSVNSAWSVLDYIDSYVKQGNEEYVKLNKYLNEYRFLPVTSILCFLHKKWFTVFKTEEIKEGKFKIANEAEAKAFLDYVKKIGFIANRSSMKIRIGTMRCFLSALLYLYRQEDIDKERLLIQLNKYSFMVERSTNIESAIINLQKIYNYKMKTSAFKQDLRLRFLNAKNSNKIKDVA